MMTHEEKYKLACLVLDAELNGNLEEAQHIQRKIPLNHKSAMAAKEVWGKDFLKNSSLNLSEAEEVYGKNWLD